MNLKPRFFLLTSFLLITTALATWTTVRTLAEGIVEQWAVRYAEKQVLYDKSRTLQPILREIALSRQLANSQPLREWASRPDDSSLTERAIVEMESFRENFQDNSYFVALLENGRYYHNNAANEFAGKQFRYVLDPGKEEDSWFYDLIRQKRDIHINVNPDVNLGITKLWIDVLIYDGNQVLGMAGTGLDLTRFLQSVVDEGVPGVTSLFVDHLGAIQLHRNQGLIDYGSVSKGTDEHKTIDLLFDSESDRAAVHSAMKNMEDQQTSVATEFVKIGGRRHLAGIVYLPEIDWFEITLLDLDVLLPFSHFSGILIVHILILLGALILFNLALNRLVLNPLSSLNRAMTQVEAGQVPDEHFNPRGTGEIHSLMRHFSDMAQSVLDSRRELEEKVCERTAALDRLTKIDSLTELFNRRGMNAQIENELKRADRTGSIVGLLWIDIDLFKKVNDTLGHGVGDQVLVAVAKVIRNNIRTYDSAGRWGGDEFLVVLPQADCHSLEGAGQRILHEIADSCHAGAEATKILPVNVSIGGHLREPGEALETLLHKADTALYTAKESGRNRFCLYSG